MTTNTATRGPRDEDDADHDASSETAAVPQHPPPQKDEDDEEVPPEAPEGGDGRAGGTSDQAGGEADAITTTTTTIPPPLIIPRRPTKRARTAYFLFADEVRSAIQKEHPGETVAVQAKRIGARWQSISGSEKERFSTLAASEKQRVATELEAYIAKYGDAVSLESSNHPGGSTDADDLVFPVARIRKIAKLDPEVRALSKEALQLVVKSAELALAKLGGECVKVARIQNRRTLGAGDVAHVCAHREVFAFLKDDIKDLGLALAEEAQHKKKQQAMATMTGGGGGTGTGTDNNHGGAHGGSKTERARKEAASGSKPLTSYFGAAK